MENPSESIFINRELSWLDFDSRVLALAKEKSVPLAERIKFAAIFGSNMDEFFMVRVGSLYDQTLLKNNKLDIVTHMTPAEQIAAITPRVAELQAKCDKYYQHLLSALKENKYIKVDFDHLDKQQEHYWKAYFTSEILPILSPQVVDQRHPFPFLRNKEIYYAAQFNSKNDGVYYGIIPLSGQFEQLLFIKNPDGTTSFAFADELIAHYAASIFNKSTLQNACLFRVTRNADITVDEGMMDHDIDFRDVMSELLKKRRKLAAVRLQFWPSAPQEIVKFLRDKLVVPADRCYTQTSPLDPGLLFRLASRVSADSNPAFSYPPARPIQAPADYDLYAEAHKHDVLLSYPYQSIRPFIRMLMKAGSDPDVVSIKMTLYRMASDSQIVQALMEAAENGKEFIVLDRPNPVGGLKIEGNLTEDDCISFVSQFKIPYLYGLTCGELAFMLNGEKMLKDGKQCKLQVVKMKGWKRKMDYTQTGLQWVPSSPHIPHPHSAFFYPVSGILGELGYMSIGVGYTIPFQMFAAPWVEAEKLARNLNGLNVPGIVFRPMYLKPFYSVGKGELLQGVQVHIMDFGKAPLSEIQFLVMQEVAALYPDRAVFDHADKGRFAMFDKVSGSKQIRERFSKRNRWEDIRDYWYKDVEEFRKLSKQYYLYK